MLTGRTVLIVETEIIISLSMQAVLHGLGATNFVVLTSPAAFDPELYPWDSLSLAIIEVEANRPDQSDLALAAARAGIAVIGLTADGQFRMPVLPDMPLVVKPVPDDILAETVTSLLQRHSL
ncbi:MAG: hypothetical protein ABS75_28305 [Pelagibacterium sp. SCN 63-23]|nr:MAG: hypothetical protein ABS75_28305 [Pelagibacterium sp. SCN 63-23]